jgi:tetratricopeptide (TPR) repeat protein
MRLGIPGWVGAGGGGGAGGGAAESYRKAVGAFPGYGAARYALGLAARQLGQVEEAKQHLAAYERDKSGAPPREDPWLDAVRALSGGVLPLLGRAKSLAQSGKPREAIALHLEALQLDPKQEQAHINLISLYGRGGDFEAAERHYGLALGLNPNRDEAHYNYGVMLQARGRLAEALEAYRKVLGVNPKHAEANNNIAYLLGSQGQLAAALRHAEAALENRPNYPQAHFNAGFLQVRLKNYAEAVRHFEAAAGANDENAARYLQALAGAQARAGNREEALRQARRAREAAMARRQGGVMAEIDREFPGLAR